MKKLIFLLSVIPLIMVSCYEGPWGARQEYTVSGNVYYPDSTPLAYASILVADTQYYSHAMSGVSITDQDFSGRADENGYFEVTVPNGGKTGIWVMAYYQPTCDTAEVTYHYHGSITKHYSDKHGFECLQIYTYIMEHPRHYPYLEPSYPFIGDSVSNRCKQVCRKTSSPSPANVPTNLKQIANNKFFPPRLWSSITLITGSASPRCRLFCNGLRSAHA